MDLRTEGFLLSWEMSGAGAALTVRRDGAREPEQLTFRFVAVLGDHRLEVTLEFPPTDRVVNISTQPGLLVSALSNGDGTRGRAGARYAALCTWVSRFAEHVGAWHPVDPRAAGVGAVVGGAAFPILGAAYDRRAKPLPEVPVWAVDILRQPTARAATRAAFSGKATRPVTLAFASSLTRDSAEHHEASQRRRARVNMTALALGLIGSTVLEPDQLARVLSSARPGVVPTKEQIALSQQVFRGLGPSRAERILTEAGTVPNGVGILNEVVSMYVQVRQFLPSRLANRLEELRAQCQALMPLDPNPGREAPSRRPRTGSRAGLRGERPVPGPRGAPVRLVAEEPLRPGHRAERPAPAARRPPEREVAHEPLPAAMFRPAEPAEAPAPRPLEAHRLRALNAPPVPLPARNAVLEFPEDIRALDGLAVREVRFVLPRTTSELAAWGRRLHNCLGSFAAAASAGASCVVGVEAGYQLRYALELTPERTIRQFLGAGNAAVPLEHARQVLEHLARCGLVDPSSPGNQEWYR